MPSRIPAISPSARIAAVETAIAVLMDELAALRAEHPSQITTAEPARWDDLIDVPAAAERFGYPADTIRHWCRTVSGVGKRRGGRWQVNVPKLRQHLFHD